MSHDAMAEWDAPEGAFWQRIPAWREVSRATFLDFQWQERNAITNVEQLASVLEGTAAAEALSQIAAGVAVNPMALRVSPYLVALIDWSSPRGDPIRRQFFPMRSDFEADHPMAIWDSLGEQSDSPADRVTHRYPHKALLLALDSCPVYCRFCTRSYAVGPPTSSNDKVQLSSDAARWSAALEYFDRHSEIDDVVLSGGDAFRLSPNQLRSLGTLLIGTPHVRRLRIATKGPAVQPMKLLTHKAWTEALLAVVEMGREQKKEVSVQTHFNHPNEITSITEDALGVLAERGVAIRNQTVLQRSINDEVDVLAKLFRRLGNMRVQPYYVYVHDLVPGVEDLRTSIGVACSLEKRLRGLLAGFNMPTFAVDLPGGGGKRGVHSYEHYDRHLGIAIYSAPAVKPGRLFAVYDPLRDLDARARSIWADADLRDQAVRSAIEFVRQRDESSMPVPPHAAS